MSGVGESRAGDQEEVTVRAMGKGGTAQTGDVRVFPGLGVGGPRMTHGSSLSSLETVGQELSGPQGPQA